MLIMINSYKKKVNKQNKWHRVTYKQSDFFYYKSYNSQMTSTGIYLMHVHYY